MPWVNKYERSDGTPVRGYFRWAPGARRDVAILAVVALAAIGTSNGTGGTGGTGGVNGRSPQPVTTMQYPITFENTTTKVKRPQPTVSYPIPWASGGTR